ncbi:uncharacterized protein LOC131956164 [Physella acuta]|uniref:uncharacterized protein LOC131956164 n=1 Tax=Physella acuta TaxID=109671 RepID=UPI0027DC479D|nr:uncharacterized protein LOC131956164 [Physella acuta]
MDHLLLIHGFETRCTTLDLRDILLKLLEHKNVEKLWLDPYRENRAVAMFKENLDLSELSRLTADELLGEIIQPTNKIFIRSFGTLKFGVKNKLEMMFKKYIYQYKDLNDDCFEVFFQGGWETVLAVCGKEWRNGEQKLTVLPYFDCFQEPFDEQTERLSNNMKFNCKVVESEVASTESSAWIQNHPTQNTESTDISVDIQQLTLQDETVETFEKSTLIHYEQSIIPWILKILNFEKALKETKFPSKVEIRPTDVTIAGSASLVKKMRQILLEKNFKMTFDHYHEMLFSDAKVLSQLKKIVDDFCYHIVIIGSDDPKMLIEDRIGQLVILPILVRKLVMRLKTYLFTNNLNFDNLVRDVNSNFKSFHILAEGEKLILFAFQGYNKDDLDNVNNLVLSLNPCSIEDTQCSSVNIDNENEQSEQVKNYYFHCESPLLAYIRKFLKDEIVSMKNLDASKRACITLGQHGIKINNSSDKVFKTIEKHLHDILSKIYDKEFRVTFPGLISFLNTEMGHQLQQLISQKYQCQFEFPQMKIEASELRDQLYELQDTYCATEYNKAVLIKTAKCTGLNVHLVQGDVMEINQDMTVEFVSSNDVEECIISTHKKTRNVTILLPKWKIPVETPVQAFSKTIRESLKKCVILMFQQAVTAQCYKIGISTTLMHDSKYPFPLDAMAEIIIDHSMILKAKSNEAQLAGILKTFDLFICESVNENVFKEFMYYLNKKGFHIEQQIEKCLAGFFHSATSGCMEVTCLEMLPWTSYSAV